MPIYKDKKNGTWYAMVRYKDWIKTVVTAGGGSVESVDKWGVKKLAYEINFKNDGYYVLMNFTAPPTLPDELERQMRISDNVMRFLVVRK